MKKGDFMRLRGFAALVALLMTALFVVPVSAQQRAQATAQAQQAETQQRRAASPLPDRIIRPMRAVDPITLRAEGVSIRLWGIKPARSGESPLELRARIQAVLRRTRGAQEPDIYRFGDAEVDFARCELRRSGEVVPITQVEFKLLTAFVRSRGRVLSREQLLDQVWANVNTGDRVVDTHVANLRKKIEPDSAAPRYLASVRGMGYRFDG